MDIHVCVGGCMCVCEFLHIIFLSWGRNLAEEIKVLQLLKWDNIKDKYFKIYNVLYNRYLWILGLFSEKNNIFKKMKHNSAIILIILNIITKKLYFSSYTKQNFSSH